MFHRKRATSNPPRHNINTPASNAALLGATRAFVKPAASNGGLSSAAAAAALRTHPSPPVQVANVQTKRMARRGSASSIGSAPGALTLPKTLQRQNSSGSMSERSFRAASPNNGSAAPNGLDLRAPPVPAIPKNLAEQSQKRASSVEPVYRVGSPQQRGRGVSLDRSGATPSPVNRPSQLASVPERDDSRRSINFSRPMSPPLSPSMSPKAASPVQPAGHSGWFTTPVTPESRISGLRNELPPLQSKINQSPIALENAQQDVRNAANKPVSKKSHAAAIEGTYLLKGAMPAKPTGTAVQAHQLSSPANRQPPSQSTSGESSPISSTNKYTSHYIASPTNLTESVNRTASVSPARSARFADGGLATPMDVKHQPPPRSLSPAKSAMKRSATSPGRTNSPRFSSAVSDHSDNMSDDGSRTGTGKKKKNVRVSFDEAAVDSRPESPSIAPTRGLAASRWSNQTLVEDDMDEIMKPRPALPSFGSLRGRRPREDGEMPEKVTETVNSSMTSSVSTIAEPLHASNDHALANVVAQDFAKKQQEKSARFDPVPPEVTSVEGSGYVSDSDTSFVDTTNGSTKQAAKSDKAAPSTVASPIVGPIIAVQPPTPKVEQEEDELFAVPGGWDEDEAGKTGFTSKDATASSKRDPKSVTQDAASSTTSSAKVPAPIEQKSTAKPDIHKYADLDGQSSDELDNALHTLEEESESDGSSIYSDAEEEHSDAGGFASLDAIVESPIVSTPPKLPKLAMESSPLAAKAPPKPIESPQEVQPELARAQSPNEDWNEAKQYWSGLSDDRRKEMEREEAVKTAQATVSSPISAEAKPKKKKKVVQPAVQSSPVAPPQQKSQPRPNQQPIKPALKKTMRAPPEPEPVPSRGPIQQRSSMRQSMRGPPPGPEPVATHMRTSMRDGGATMRSPIKQGGLALSKYSDASEPRGALQKRNIPTNNVTPPVRPRSTTGIAASKYATAPAGKSRQTTADPNDSDASESSFRRSRPRNREGGGMTMRRSMRAQPTAPMPSSRRPASTYTPSLRPMSPDNPPPRSSRLSVRSLSPPGSMFRKKFRSGSIDGGAPTMRNQERPTSKGSIFSFGKKDKKDKFRPMSSSSAMAAPRMTATRAQPPARRFKSRFADSSDEEEDDEFPVAQPSFRSRFADSDSDDDAIPPLPMPKDLAPVRGIPRKAGDDDRSSTDLEDERSDRDVEKPAAASKPTTQGSALAAGSIRDSKHARIADDVPEPSPALKEKKRRNFFGLGRKKGASRTDLPAIAPLGTARPGTPPNRSATASPAPQSPGSPSTRSPKLQRRITPQRVMSDSWPLPTPPPIPGLEERPNSSDGYVVNGGGLRSQVRPGLGKRMSSQGTAVTAPVGNSAAREREVVLGRTGKKKKFPGLRRMFGLHD